MGADVDANEWDLCGTNRARARARKFAVLCPWVSWRERSPGKVYGGARKHFLSSTSTSTNKNGLQLCLIGVAQDTGENELARLVVDYRE